MSHSEGVERELKFAVVDHDALRERLESLEAERQGSPAFEDNWVFDREGVLEEEGRMLRLRLGGSGSWLTIKGPASYEGRVKVREETETSVGDAEKMRSILEALGYRLAYRYQKYREEWHLGSIVISLDHTPVGDFVEFEGEGCEKIAQRSGFDPEDAERRNYLRLWADHQEKNPEAPPDMVFRET
ncbi:MAG: class IV adenylate cyclase [Acidobacteriota bacterium]